MRAIHAEYQTFCQDAVPINTCNRYAGDGDVSAMTSILFQHDLLASLQPFSQARRWRDMSCDVFIGDAVAEAKRNYIYIAEQYFPEVAGR